jgi:hypothetical protein
MYTITLCGALISGFDANNGVRATPSFILKLA